LSTRRTRLCTAVAAGLIAFLPTLASTAQAATRAPDVVGFTECMVHTFLKNYECGRAAASGQECDLLPYSCGLKR
jgi:hypothetical protein